MAVAVLEHERSQPWTVVVCDVCGQDFRLSVRNAREYQRRGKPPRCRTCRRPAKPLTPVERARYERFWLSKFTRAELVALADAIWGPR
jgi:hypothetical protein